MALRVRENLLPGLSDLLLHLAQVTKRQRFIAQSFHSEEKAQKAGAQETEYMVKTKSLSLKNNCAPEKFSYALFGSESPVLALLSVVLNHAQLALCTLLSEGYTAFQDTTQLPHN